MSISRQLAAIMFTDIVGYTSLMGEDEQQAFDLLRKNRNLQQPLIGQYNGRWIKELGDGVLASFHTVIDAVLCAGAIHHASDTVPSLKLRIGIHLGDVVFENNDVFGDGVNIASRLQALAPVGGIWISESVHKNISNKKGISSTFIQEEILKNVKEPVRIYEVKVNAPEGTIPAFTNDLSGPVKGIPEKSIAVLPFVNMSNDPEQDYFGDGIAEEILNSLVHLKELKVAGRTSSFQFKAKNTNLSEIGEKLGVRTIMEGSVRKQGNRLRVTAQLINVEDGYHLWSERYDRDMDDIFSVQDEIALAITEKLKVTLLEKDRKIITKTYTQNSAAYDLYLKGRFTINRRGRFILSGMQYFQEAISIDPGFAPAYAGYADSCALAAFYNFFPAKEIMPKAKQAADHAIQIDNSLCEPYTSLGFYYAFYEWKFAESKKNFCKAIELNPAYTVGHLWYGMLYLSWIEMDFRESQKEGWMAIKIEPFSAIAHALQTVNYYVAREYEEAVRIGRLAIDLDANSYLVYKMTALAYIGLNKIQEAIEMIHQTLRTSNRFQWSMYDLMWAYSHIGDKAAIVELIAEMNIRADKEYISPFNMALAYAWIEDLNEAITYLEKAYNERDPMLLTIKTWPNVPDNLKNDPRCQELINRIGFPE
ncbi:MAG: adenylate/guanylate cyclase domain-containing protein [Bacteroidota bacterium]|nr:adenylate/guanylate cyclase domain-containing protein [Bacteroidota bacterium]